MAYTIKTISKLFMLFLFFQLMMNLLVEVLPSTVPNFSEEDRQYLNFIADKTNGQLNAEEEGRTLRDNFESSISTENLFNDSLIDSFLGVFKIIGQLIRFLVEVALLILFTPSIIMEILLYDFIASATILFSVSLIVNIFFYMVLFYIVYKTRTQN